MKAAFFDRDGTLIKNVHYLSDLQHIELIKEMIAICKACMEKGYKLFVVSNQSGVARGFFDENFVRQTHEELARIFAEHGIVFEKFYFCPHLQGCLCRKPQPGMLHEAAQEFNLDLSSSLMIGDSECDVRAGEAAGCKTFYVETILHESLDDFIKQI